MKKIVLMFFLMSVLNGCGPRYDNTICEINVPTKIIGKWKVTIASKNNTLSSVIDEKTFVFSTKEETRDFISSFNSQGISEEYVYIAKNGLYNKIVKINDNSVKYFAKFDYEDTPTNSQDLDEFVSKLQKENFTCD